jgi:hypothetical protein
MKMMNPNCSLERALPLSLLFNLQTIAFETYILLITIGMCYNCGMSGKAFLSHTKLDSKFCDRFDNVCASVGLARFRSDFADIAKPSWSTIKYELEQSSVLFLLVGKELVKQQATPTQDWKHTQNWISYEVGLAHGRGIDVWVVCDSVEINFPVPYFNNYAPFGLEPGIPMQYMQQIFTT